jgi:pimeloyl-ACP methyl ester carboxylesterase
MPQITNNGVTIHYRVEGSGQPLILQHGFADSCESWYDLGYVDSLKSKYLLILPDTRGHGRSGKPHNPEAYTPLNFASDIAAVLDDAGVQKTYYWGYSQGGWIGFALAQHVPERFSCFVIGGAASAGSAFTAKPGEEDPLIAVLRRGTADVHAMFGEWLTPKLAERLNANDTDALIACRQQRLATAGYPNTEKIAVPTLLYSGTADPIHDPAQQTASRIPGAEFVSLPDLLHIAAFCRPDLILPQVQGFLAKQAG